MGVCESVHDRVPIHLLTGNYREEPEMSGQFPFRFELDGIKDIQLNLSSDVFAPTGTTTALVNAVQTCVQSPGKLLDLGCGSGVVGIALSKMGLVEFPLYASDLSRQAVKCIQQNADFHSCSVVAKCGPLFDPWKDETFDYIIDDVSGVAQEIAEISPWFQNVPCESGIDGTSLVIEVLQKAKRYLNSEGRLFFPVVSFSNVDKIVQVARDKFSRVELLTHQEWPLPKEMYTHLSLLQRLRDEGHIQFIDKFGMVVFFTDVYVAYN
jgi:precorrin-6B methylase 2